MSKIKEIHNQLEYKAKECGCDKCCAKLEGFNFGVEIARKEIYKNIIDELMILTDNGDRSLSKNDIMHWKERLKQSLEVKDENNNN